MRAALELGAGPGQRGLVLQDELLGHLPVALRLLAAVAQLGAQRLDLLAQRGAGLGGRQKSAREAVRDVWTSSGHDSTRKAPDAYREPDHARGKAGAGRSPGRHATIASSLADQYSEIPT